MKYSKLEIAIDNLMDNMAYHVERYLQGDTDDLDVSYDLHEIKLENPTESDLDALNEVCDETDYFSSLDIEDNKLIISFSKKLLFAR